MAATLEWTNRTAFSGDLRLGGWLVGSVWRESSGRGSASLFHYELPDAECHGGGPYEVAADAFADCETAVRRLLKEAGVDLG